MKNLGLAVLVLILGTLLGLLGTKIILSVSTLYGLTFLVELGFVKLYGLLSVVGIVLHKSKDFDDSSSEEERISIAFKGILTKTCLYLLFWGLSFLMFYILT